MSNSPPVTPRIRTHSSVSDASSVYSPECKKTKESDDVFVSQPESIRAIFNELFERNFEKMYDDKLKPIVSHDLINCVKLCQI